jgi:hypothetical protein
MPGLQMIPHMMGQRPLFPAASMAAAASQQKPTFPAYSNATISAPPTLVGASSTSTNVNDAQKPPTIPQSVGTASKIIHPPEDISLEELRARRPQYRLNRNSAPSPHSAASTPTSMASNHQRSEESKMVQAAHEVSPAGVDLSPHSPHTFA